MQVRNIAKTMVFGLASLASASALAFDFDGVYVLGGIGYAGVEDAKFNDDTSRNFNGQYLGDTAGRSKEADGNLSWRAGLGSWLTDNFAIEVNYFGIADMDSKYYTDYKDGTSSQTELKTTGMYWIDVSGVGRCNFTDNLWGFARLGVAWAKVDRKEYIRFYKGGESAGKGKVAQQDTGGLGAALGIGAQYDFTPMFGARVEVSTVQALNNNDMYAVTGALVVNFGEFM